jgi:hypothetical protein
MRVSSDPRANHTRGVDSNTFIKVLRRSQGRSTKAPKEGWSTLPIPTTEGREDTRVAHAPPKRDAESREQESPYGKISDVLNSHLLSLQHRDAWLSKKEWETYPDQRIPEGPFRGRWSADHTSLIRHDGAIYIPEDLVTRMEILRANHDDPW